MLNTCSRWRRAVSRLVLAGTVLGSQPVGDRATASELPKERGSQEPIVEAGLEWRTIPGAEDVSGFLKIQVRTSVDAPGARVTVDLPAILHVLRAPGGAAIERVPLPFEEELGTRVSWSTSLKADEPHEATIEAAARDSGFGAIEMIVAFGEPHSRSEGFLRWIRVGDQATEIDQGRVEEWMLRGVPAFRDHQPNRVAASPAPPIAPDIACLEGNVVYEDKWKQQHPLRHATVSVGDRDSDLGVDHLASGLTDEKGRFIVCFPNSDDEAIETGLTGQDVFFEVRLENPSWTVAPGEGKPAYAYVSPEPPPCDCDVDEGVWASDLPGGMVHDVGTIRSPKALAPVLDRAASVHDSIFIGWEWMWKEKGSTSFGGPGEPALVLWGDPDQFPDELEAPRTLTLASWDYGSRDRVLHTLGHLVRHRIQDGLAAGTEACAVYAFMSVSPPECAFEEGFAYYFAARAAGSPMLSGWSLESIEWDDVAWMWNGARPIPDRGENVPAAVAAAFWDLWDLENEPPWDRSGRAAGKDEGWDVIRGAKPSTFLPFVESYLELRSATPGSSAREEILSTVFQSAIELSTSSPPPLGDSLAFRDRAFGERPRPWSTRGFPHRYRFDLPPLSTAWRVLLIRRHGLPGPYVRLTELVGDDVEMLSEELSSSTHAARFVGVRNRKPQGGTRVIVPEIHQEADPFYSAPGYAASLSISETVSPGTTRHTLSAESATGSIRAFHVSSLSPEKETHVVVLPDASASVTIDLHGLDGTSDVASSETSAWRDDTSAAPGPRRLVIPAFGASGIGVLDSRPAVVLLARSGAGDVDLLIDQTPPQLDVSATVLAAGTLRVIEVKALDPETDVEMLEIELVHLGKSASLSWEALSTDCHSSLAPADPSSLMIFACPPGVRTLNLGDVFSPFELLPSQGIPDMAITVTNRAGLRATRSIIRP